MSYTPEKHLASREAKLVTLQVGEDEIQIKFRHVAWKRKNQIITQALKFDDKGNTLFDGDYYVCEYLKEAIVEAPWGATTDVFLSQVGDGLGAALESLVPKAFGARSTTNPDEVKKEL